MTMCSDNHDRLLSRTRCIPMLFPKKLLIINEELEHYHLKEFNLLGRILNTILNRTELNTILTISNLAIKSISAEIKMRYEFNFNHVFICGFRWTISRLKLCLTKLRAIIFINRKTCFSRNSLFFMWQTFFN